MSVSKFRFARNPAPAAREPWIGEYKELGKTEARQCFLHLLDDLKDKPTSMAITDRGEKVAVIMGYKQYQLLIAIFQQHTKAAEKNPFAGLITKIGDLEKGQAEINALFQESLMKTSDSI